MSGGRKQRKERQDQDPDKTKHETDNRRSSRSVASVLLPHGFPQTAGASRITI